MIIRNQPESLSLSGNLRHLVVRSTGDLTLTIKEAGAEDPFLQQIYTPDSQGNVDVDLKDIVFPRLSVIIEDTADAYRQMSVVKTFVVGLKDDERTDTVSFAVLRAGVAQLPDGDTANFLQQHFLTWQPTLKQVTYYTPEFLTYYAVVASVIKCRTTVIDSGNQNQRTITLASINAGECWTVPVGYSVIAGKINDLPSYYEVWVEDAHGERLTDIQQYAASDMKSEEEQWILFENSLGGVDTFRAYGTYEAIADHAHHVAEMSELQQEYRVDTVRKYKKSTGFLGRYERLWLLDFFPSMGKYLHTGSMIRRIVVTESEVDYNAKELPSEYTFTYRYAESVPYLNINRTAVDISTLNITVPDIGSFTVAPRLVEFPRTPLSDGALIPVQSPYSESWGATTMAAVLSWILRHADIPASKYSEDFLSKIYDDVAAGTISFMKGLISHGRSVFRGVAEFLNGINVEGDADISGHLTTGGDIHTTGTLSVDGNAELKGDLSVNGSLTAKVIRQDVMMSTNYSGDGIGDKGWKLTNNDGSGRSKLTVDRLYVRQDFAAETLQVKRSYVTSGNHVDSAAANIISRTDYLKLDSTTGEYDIIGYKRIKVPFVAKQWIMMLSKFQIRGIFSRTKMIRVPVAVQDIDRIRCYFLANDGNKKIDNNWVVGDLARCQTYNITGQWRRNTWTTQIGDSHTGNVFWWRKVVAVSNAPVEIDGMQYHYFDVAMGDCAENSTIPAEGDDVCQWGHVSNPERMNVIVHEVAGSDAPAIKSYEGIYCYDMSKSWFGGNTKKMNLSPKTEYLFNGRKFRIETDYGVQPISVDRGEWDNINQEPDDYEPTEMVRKCYYGDKVTHNGSYWRCILSNNGEHWVDNSGQYISDATYDSLTPEEKATCTRKQNYITAEPADNSAVWEKQVDRGTSVKSVSVAYAKQTSAQYTGKPPVSGWQPTIAGVGTLHEGDFLWTRTVTTYSDTLEDTTVYSVTKWGVDGDGIENIETKFYEDSRLLTQQQLASLTEDKWKEYGQLPITSGDYIYTRTKITYDKGDTPTVSYMVNRIGQDGVGYVATEEYYVLGNSQTNAPSGHPYTGTGPYKRYTAAEWQQVQITGGWSESRPTYQGDANKYLWNFEVSFDTEGSAMVTRPICIANFAKGIASIQEMYAISASAVAPAGHDYPTDITEWTDEAHDCAPTDLKPYQWNKTVTTYTDGTADIFYHVSAVKGTRGRGITSITKTYAISAQGTTASDKTPPSDVTSWSQGSPATTDAKPYLWVKEISEFTDSTTDTVYYPIGKKGDRGIDAKDIEWAYIRTKTNVAPVISSDNTYVDSNGNDYTEDDHLPHVDGNSNIENNEDTYECTDDPKGVDDIWKYEWEIKRTKGAAVDGRRSWDYYQGMMTLHNNLAESAFIVDLDNDNDQFGTDSDSKVLVEQTRQTTVSLYDGSAQQTLTSLTATLTYEDDTDVPSSVATVVATSSTGVVAVTVKANATSNTHSEIRASITAVCAKGSKQAVFTLRKVMGGAPGLNPIIYQLAPTQKVFQFSRADNNTLTPSSRSTQINVAKTEGNTTAILSTAQAGITYSWGFDDDAAQETGKAIGTSISVSSTQAAIHHQIWVELSAGDRETLPIVKDGINGQDGESPYFADIDNEMESVACDNSGKTTTAFDKYIGVSLWHGSTPSDITTLTTTSVSGLTITPDKANKRIRVQVAQGTTIAEVNDITITIAGGDSGNKTLHFVLNGIRAGKNGEPAVLYSLVPSASSVVKKNNGTYSVNNISCTRQKNVGGMITDNTTDGEIKYKLDGGSEHTYTNNTNIAVSNFTNSIQFIFRVDGKVVDTETIPKIADGTDGVPAITGYCDYLFGRDALGNVKPAASEAIEGAIDLLYYTGSPKQNDCIDVVEGSQSEGWWWGGWSVEPGTAYIWRGNGHVYRATNHGWEDEGQFNGEDGKDGVVVTLNPQSIIMNQDITTKQIDLSGARTVAEVRVGNTDMSAYATLTATGTHCNVSVSGMTVEITQILSSEGQYYKTGYVDIAITFDGKTYNRRLSWAVNLVGSWAETIEGDMKRELANSSLFYIDPQTNQIVETTNWGEFKRSSEANISKLQKDTVKRNLFPIKGWRLNDSGYSATDYDKAYDRSYEEAMTTNDIYSPVIELSEGDYCFSGYVPSGRSFDTYGNTIQVVYGCSAADPASGSQYINAKSVGELTGDTIKINGNIYIKRYAVFSIPATAMCSINLWGNTGYGDVAQPKIVAGTTPDVDTTMSVINQTAEEINQSVSNLSDRTQAALNLKANSADLTTMQNGLETAGVHLDGENSKIRLNAETTEISGDLYVPRVETTGNPNRKIVIDSETFRVYNQDGIAGISIGWDSDGEPFLLFTNADGSRYVRISYSDIDIAGSQFTADAFAQLYYLPVVSGSTQCDWILYGNNYDEYTQYYRYSAAKNTATGVYSSEIPDRQGQYLTIYQRRRSERDGKVMTTNVLSDVLGETTQYIANGYYLSHMYRPVSREQEARGIICKYVWPATLGNVPTTSLQVTYMQKIETQEGDYEYMFCNADGSDRAYVFDANRFIFNI